MRIVYPLLWSRLGREADQEQSIATATALARQGAEVTLLMPRGAGDPPLDAGTLSDWFDVRGDFALVQERSRWAGPQLWRTILWVRQLARLPEVRQADLLYSRIPLLFATGQALPLPFAVEHYRPWPDDWPFLGPFIRATARHARCRGFILHSDYAAASYRRAGIPPAKILVARNGVDPDRFRDPPGPAEARARLGLPARRPIAVYAGRLSADKALDQILALADLRPEVLFLLVGSEGEGPVEAEARRRANVRALPWQPPAGLPGFLHAADVLLIPASTRPLRRSRRCVLPMKTFAYLAAGRPILAPRAPDTAELLRHGENAFFVEPERPDLAAAALDEILADSALAERLASGAARSGRGLSWDARARNILGFLGQGAA